MKCLQGRVKIPIGGTVRDWLKEPLTRCNSGTDSDVHSHEVWMEEDVC